MGQIQTAWEPARDAEPLIGGSPAMVGVRRAVREYGRTASPVLVTGETGTGKGVVAAGLHRQSRRGPFVTVNCAALSLSLFESELFGSLRGAYTGADRNRGGLVASARGGTLFLDEIGELPAEAQPKLLHLLENGAYRPVGASDERRADVRLVTATNRDLGREVEAGRFRADLYYRLSVLSLGLPPLRERKDDIPELVACFLEQLGAPGRAVSAGALEDLQAWDWPGNVRELRHAVERTLVGVGVGPIRGFAIDPSAPRPGGSVPRASRASAAEATPAALPGSRREFREQQRAELLQLLNDEAWNVSAAARRLGISRGGLRSRMRILGLRS